MKTLQTKLLLGLLPTLAILVLLGLWAVIMFYRLGGNIDVILRENFTSVLAAEGMKEAIERMDSGLLFAVGGRDRHGRDQFEANRPLFLAASEDRASEHHASRRRGSSPIRWTVLFTQYVEHAETILRAAAPSRPSSGPRFTFRSSCRRSTRSRRAPTRSWCLNQENMSAMDRRARANAATSIRLMIGALIGAVVLAVAVALHLSRSILKPIHMVTDGARALARGELDQIVPAASRDELGDLANAFNEMARTLREYRQAGTARLLRAQKTAQATIDSFPDPVVVVDPMGSVEQANRAARRLLGVSPATESPVPWHPAAALEIADQRRAGRPRRLPAGLARAGDLALRRRPGALFSAAGAGHSHRGRRDCSARLSPWST